MVTASRLVRCTSLAHHENENTVPVQDGIFIAHGFLNYTTFLLDSGLPPLNHKATSYR